MKKTIKGLAIFSILFMFFAINTAKACEIEITVQGDKKEVYKVGDEIVVKVSVTLIHRACPISMEKTKFEPKGMKILQATKWKEVSSNVWERKMKLKVTGTKDGKLNFSAERTCDLEGGFGEISLECKP